MNQLNGLHKVEFLNGTGRTLNIKAVQYNSDGTPVMILDSTGTFYSWVSILCLAPVLQENVMHEVKVNGKTSSCSCGWMMTEMTEHWANRSGQKHARENTPAMFTSSNTVDL